MKYPLTFYVDSLPPNVGGCANGPVIRILKKYKGDEGLLRHELIHVFQWVFSLGLHSILYRVSDWYKLGAEVAAYREQLKHYPDDRTEMFAGFIAKYYNLNITKEEAIGLLK